MHSEVRLEYKSHILNTIKLLLFLDLYILSASAHHQETSVH